MIRDSTSQYLRNMLCEISATKLNLRFLLYTHKLESVPEPSSILALEQGLSVIGWSEMPDLSGTTSREAMEVICKDAYSDAPQNRIKNFVGQLWAFRDRIHEGDLVVLPLKSSSMIAIGKIVGPYKYQPDLPEDARHTRATEWIRIDIPRSAVDQDLLYSFGRLPDRTCESNRAN